MTLGELIRRGNGLVPEAGDETVIPSLSTTQLSKADIFSEGAREFARYTECFPKDKKFNCAASTSSYSLTSNIPDYWKPREGGLWHYRTQSNTASWERVKPTTQRLMDERYSSWRNDSISDYVDHYWIDGDILNVHYTPSSAVTNGFQFYYYGLSTDMTALNQYPFTGTTSQDVRLSLYDRILLVYYEYRVLGILGYKDDAVKKELEFYQLCDKAKGELQDRSDVAQEAHIRPKSYISRMRGMYG